MPGGDRTDWGFERTFGGCHPHEAEEAKGVRADSKRLEKLNTQRREMLSLIPLLTSGWIKVIDDEIAKTIQNYPGIEDLRSPVELSRGIAESGR